MLNTEDMVFEFDPDTRIVHLTATKPVHVRTEEDGRQMVRAVFDGLNSYLFDGRGFLVSNYNKIIIEPDLLKMYAEAFELFFDKYLYPNGVARYGFEITRITAKLGHLEYLGGSPNLFESKEEAINFIKTLPREEAAPADQSMEGS